MGGVGGEEEWGGGGYIMQSHQVPARKSQHFMCPLLAKYRKHGDRYIFKKEKLCMWCTFCGLYYLVHTVFIYCKFFAILILATRWIPSDLGLDPNPLKNGLDKWSNIILYFAVFFMNKHLIASFSVRVPQNFSANP